MLYIIRHGRTDWNDLRKMQGQTDIPLNDNGREMARHAHDEYLDIHFDICFCSPLIRARETADLLLEGRNIPIEYDDRLKEMCFGEYEGLANSFDIPDCPINAFFLDPENYVASKGAESIQELLSRTSEFLNEKVYPLLFEGKDVLIVGHGAMNSSIICNVMHRDISEFWASGIENCVLKKLIVTP